VPDEGAGVKVGDGATAGSDAGGVGGGARGATTALTSDDSASLLFVAPTPIKEESNWFIVPTLPLLSVES
jgi:hypothetical protein